MSKSHWTAAKLVAAARNLKDEVDASKLNQTHQAQ